MRVLIVCHPRRGSRLGNRVTAERWRELLVKLGHRVTIATALPRKSAKSAEWDVLVALHARHAAKAIRDAHAAHPKRPIILALTGTDLYRDIRHDADARRSLELAERIVVLHDRAPLDVPARWRRKVRVIRQSADEASGYRLQASGKKGRRYFEVVLVAHLRAEKDPLLAAQAARLLPRESRVRIRHVGRALSDEMRKSAQREARSNERYEWLGEVSRARALELIARSDVLVLTSVMEGGANVLGEAIVAGTPPIASRIPASVAALGARYPGLFRVGDARGLARLLLRAEKDGSFLTSLKRRVGARRKLFRASAEKSAWRTLLANLDRDMQPRKE